MSISSNVTPSAFASRVASDFEVSPVAKPGIVNASTSLRGRPSRSIALAATIRAWVESSPPLTPITALGCPIASHPLDQAGDLDVVGLVAVLRQPLGVVGHEREPVDVRRSPMSPVGGASSKPPSRPERGRSATGSNRRCRAPAGCRRSVPCRIRSCRIRSRSTSTTVRRGPSGKRSLSPSRSPHS